ncbi:hypothetical protein CsatB_006914 [Cannabis sativa]
MAANPITAFFLLLITQILLFSISTAQQNNTTKMISLISSISTSTKNSYWLSNSGQFGFGFYKQGNGFSIGIWFDNIKEKTVVWTWNRDQQQPLPQSTTLVLNDFANFVSPDQPAASASMLDSRKELVSAVSESNHSSGRFQLIMQTDGNLVQYPRMSNVEAYHAYWDSKTNGKGSQNVTLNFDANGNLYMYNTTSSSNIKTIHSVGWGHKSGNGTYRLTIDADGILRLYSHSIVQVNSNWNIEWNSSNNRCDLTGVCGMNAYCVLEQNQQPNCTCLPGHDFIDQQQRSLGCERILWENNYYSIVPKNSRIACEQDCLKDCQCEIAMYTSNTCDKLRLPLRYAKVDQRNSDVVTMVKVLSQSSEATTTWVTKGRSERVRNRFLISSVVCFVFSFIFLLLSMFLCCRRNSC